MRRVLAILAVVFALVPVSAEAGPRERAKKDAAAKIVTLARWCAKRGLVAEAKAHLDEALALVPGEEGATALKATLGDPKEPTPEVKAAYEKEREAAGKPVARLYVTLFEENHPAAEQATFDGYLVKALAWSAEVARKPFDAAWRAAKAAGDVVRVDRLLSAAPDRDTNPEIVAVRKEIELRLSSKKPILRTAKSHPIQYWLSLPAGWSPDRTWPVLVTADGAGHNWEGSCKWFAAERDKNSLPFIVVSLVRLNPKDYGEETFKANLRAASRDDLFDLKGARTIVTELVEEVKARERFYVTGFSAGGAVTWYLTIFHPEWLTASAPACGGFGLRSSPGEKPVSEAPERATLPIRCFQGVDDKLALGPIAGNPDAIRAEWKPHADSFAAHGFLDVDLVLLDKVGHSPCVAPVTAFFADVLHRSESAATVPPPGK